MLAHLLAPLLLQPLPVHGDGRQTRSYLYVEDVAEAFDLILHRGTVGEIYNIGSQIERSVLSVAADIARLSRDAQEHTTTDPTSTPPSPPSTSTSTVADDPSNQPTTARPHLDVVYCRDRLFNDQRYFICDAKLQALGWRERTPWEEGLRKTLTWYGTPGRVAAWWPMGVDQALLPHPDADQIADADSRDVTMDLLSQFVRDEDELMNRNREPPRET